MPHFLISKEEIKEDKIELIDKETIDHLLKSLRVKKGEKVKFIDKDENVYLTEIIETGKNKLISKIITREKSIRKLNFELDAVISVLKPDAMHLAIQNAVQAGAKKIYTVYSDNAAVKYESILNKKEKWQKIGMEAFKQCERADIPEIYDVIKFDEIFKNYKKENIIVFAEKYAKEDVKKIFDTINKKERILAVFGPEGGFSEKEFDYFKSKNIKLTTLGNLILKAPNAVTAGLFGIITNYDNKR